MYRPSAFQPIDDYVAFHSENLGPFGDTPRHAIIGYEAVPAPISGLHPLGCPHTILWAIVTVVILPFNRVTDWPWPHVIQKSFE